MSASLYDPTAKQSQACIVLQGFIDAVIYGANESSLACWRNLLFPQSFPTIDGVRELETPVELERGHHRWLSTSKPAATPHEPISTSRASTLSLETSTRQSNGKGIWFDSKVHRL
jgi:hypothetical protein